MKAEPLDEPDWQNNAVFRKCRAILKVLRPAVYPHG